MDDVVPGGDSSSRNVSEVFRIERGANGRVGVYLANGSSFFVSGDFADLHAIAPGLTVSEDLQASIDAEASRLKAYDKGLEMLAKREQTENKREINPHGKKSVSTLADQQVYLISSISDIGPKAARSLLLHFGSVEAIMKADTEELRKVKSIGPKTAARIREVIGSPYKG